MNKILMTSQVFSEKKHGCETSNGRPCDKYQYGDEIRFKGMIKSPSLML